MTWTCSYCGQPNLMENYRCSKCGRSRDSRCHDLSKRIVIPEGILCGYCCSDCIFMNLKDRNDYGEFWCGKRQKYYPPDDAASNCSYFQTK